jgi:hypothetical protein
MANGGLVASGVVITAFALLLLNPAFKLVGLGWFSSPIPTDTIEWTVVAAVIFATVFLTGAAMMAKGFLERKVVKSTALREVEAA